MEPAPLAHYAALTVVAKQNDLKRVQWQGISYVSRYSVPAMFEGARLLEN